MDMDAESGWMRKLRISKHYGDQGWNSARKQASALFIDVSQSGTAIFPAVLESVLAQHSHRLKILKPMPHSLGVIIPGTYSVDSPTDTTSYRDQLMKIMTDFAGGASSTPVRGVYKTRTGEVVWEDSWLVWCSLELAAMADALPVVFDFVNQLLEELGQESVVVVINQRPLLLGQP